MFRNMSDNMAGITVLGSYYETITDYSPFDFMSSLWSCTLHIFNSPCYQHRELIQEIIQHRGEIIYQKKELKKKKE